VQVVNVNFVLDGVPAEFIGGAVDEAAANAAAGELPTTVRNAVAGMLTDLSSDHAPSSGGSSSEHPLQRRPG
jgi:hypothetical protein